MDEARLKEIEARSRVKPLYGMNYLDATTEDEIHELVAAVRIAERKLNIAIDNSTAWEMKYHHELERADRAEAEVRRQQGTILSQAESIRLLYGVFLAAEELWAALAPAAIPILGPPGENLRRALSAAKDPVR